MAKDWLGPDLVIYILLPITGNYVDNTVNTKQKKDQTEKSYGIF